MSSIEELINDIESGIEEGSIDSRDTIKAVQTLDDSQPPPDHPWNNETLRRVYESAYRGVDAANVSGNFIELATSLLPDVPSIFPFMYHMLGVGYFIAAEWDTAIENFTNAIEKDDSYADSYYFRGLCYWFKLHEEFQFPSSMEFLSRDYDIKAFVDWKKADQLNPNHPLKDTVEYIENLYIFSLQAILRYCEQEGGER